MRRVLRWLVTMVAAFCVAMLGGVGSPIGPSTVASAAPSSGYDTHLDSPEAHSLAVERGPPATCDDSIPLAAADHRLSARPSNAVPHGETTYDAPSMLTRSDDATGTTTVRVAPRGMVDTLLLGRSHVAAEAAAGAAARFDANALSAAGLVADRNGLTAAGRAAQKHGSRTGTFPQSLDRSAAGYNKFGQEILDDLLQNPKTAVQEWNHPSFGDVIDLHLPDYGARFTRGGTIKFIGFL